MSPTDDYLTEQVVRERNAYRDALVEIKVLSTYYDEQFQPEYARIRGIAVAALREAHSAATHPQP